MPEILVYKIIESNESCYFRRKFLLLQNDYYRVVYAEWKSNI
jgi:hypothetical protein